MKQQHATIWKHKISRWDENEIVWRLGIVDDNWYIMSWKIAIAYLGTWMRFDIMIWLYDDLVIGVCDMDMDAL